MNTLFTIMENYLEYCETQKGLDKKTLKAYRTDSGQFVSFFNNTYINTISIPEIEKYIVHIPLERNSQSAPAERLSAPNGKFVVN